VLSVKKSIDLQNLSCPHELVEILFLDNHFTSVDELQNKQEELKTNVIEHNQRIVCKWYFLEDVLQMKVVSVINISLQQATHLEIRRGRAEKNFVDIYKFVIG